MTDPQWSTEGNWRQLESAAAAPTHGEFRVLDTTLRVEHGAVLLALDASGLRHVLVPVAADFETVHDRRSGGVHLTTRLLIDDAGQRQFLDLACQKLHLNNVFAHLSEEALSSLNQDRGNPFQACRQALQRWRELLDREPSSFLPTEALCGLFGELWHLARIANLNFQGILSWQGPHGARHDFTAAGWALEVKTTLQRDEWKFRIHGLTQLDKPTDAILYLSAMRLELNGAAGKTIPELIQDILQVGVDRHELLSRLSLVGYDLRDESHYAQFRFDVVDFRTYEVGESFPRLVDLSFSTGELPLGVSDIHYTIDLRASQATACSPDVLESVHTALSGVRNGGAS